MELKKLNFETEKASFAIDKREKTVLGIQISDFIINQKFYSDDPKYFEKYLKLSTCRQILNKIRKSISNNSKSITFTIPEVCFLAIEESLVLNPEFESFEVFDGATLMKIQKELLKYSYV